MRSECSVWRGGQGGSSLFKADFKAGLVSGLKGDHGEKKEEEEEEEILETMLEAGGKSWSRSPGAGVRENTPFPPGNGRKRSPTAYLTAQRWSDISGVSYTLPQAADGGG